MYLKLLVPEAFSAQNTPNIVWRPGSTRTDPLGAYSAAGPLVGLRGAYPTSKGSERKGSGGRGGNGRGQRLKKDGYRP